MPRGVGTTARRDRPPHVAMILIPMLLIPEAVGPGRRGRRADGNPLLFTPLFSPARSRSLSLFSFSFFLFYPTLFLLQSTMYIAVHRASLVDPLTIPTSLGYFSRLLSLSPSILPAVRESSQGAGGLPCLVRRLLNHNNHQHHHHQRLILCIRSSQSRLYTHR